MKNFKAQYLKITVSKFLTSNASNFYNFLNFLTKFGMQVPYSVMFKKTPIKSISKISDISLFRRRGNTYYILSNLLLKIFC